MKNKEENQAHEELVPGMYKENILTDGTMSQNVVQGCTQCTGVCRIPCYRGATEC